MKKAEVIESVELTEIESAGFDRYCLDRHGIWQPEQGLL
jgi:hypothetical protein